MAINRSLVVGLVAGVTCSVFSLLISYMLALEKSSIVAIALFAAIFGTFGGMGLGIQFPKIAALSVAKMVRFSIVIGILGIVGLFALFHIF